MDGVSAIKTLAEAIGYPDAVADDATEYRFGVDDGEIRAREVNSRLYLECTLYSESEALEGDDDQQLLVKLAGLAAGRVLREEAVLAWDERRGELILTQDVPASFPSEKLLRFFEVFTASCDWWLERIEETHAPVVTFPEMMIMP